MWWRCAEVDVVERLEELLVPAEEEDRALDDEEDGDADPVDVAVVVEAKSPPPP